MSYIIGKPCVSVCDTICVSVCPVDCIHGPIDIDGAGMEVDGMSKEELVGKQLYIDPTECIDCGACLPECPVDAIYADEDETIEIEGDDSSVKKNYEFFNQKWNN
jgi:ferredoxin|tara:strand:- start:7149 stop:7463 length:315 start_codon:yes stop_codon:yes gene_type:complete